MRLMHTDSDVLRVPNPLIRYELELICCRASVESILDKSKHLRIGRGGMKDKGLNRIQCQLLRVGFLHRWPRVLDFAHLRIIGHPRQKALPVV